MKKGLCSLIFILSIVPAGAALASGAISIGAVTPDADISAGTAVSFQATASGFVGVPRYVMSDSLPASTVSNSDISIAGQFNWTPTQLDVGTHVITLTASDAYGDQSSVMQTLVVEQASPLSIQYLSPGTNLLPGDTLSFSIGAPGFSNPAFSIGDSFSVSSISYNNISSAGNVSWTPKTSDVGVHDLTVTINADGGRVGHVSQAVTVNGISVQNISGTSVPVGSALTFTVVPYGMNTSSALTYVVGDSASNNTLSNGDFSGNSFSWTPQTQDIGTHVISITGTDANGIRATAQLSVTIVGNAVAPAVYPAQSSVQTAAQTATAAYVFTKPLSVGSSGTEVTELQKRLTSLGYYSGPVTGYYGSLTRAAVIRLQKAHKLTQLGSVGPGTRAVLNAK